MTRATPDGADRARHRGLPTALRPPSAGRPPQTTLIEQSHQRCEALGLSRIERPDYAPLGRGDVALAVERTQRLCAHAAPVMELLLEQITGTESMIVLTDAQGTILHSLGDADFLARAGKVALTPGVSWAEHSKGTNAIGTALFEEAPTLVHANQHFMHANSFLTCSAAPIFDPRGSMLGVLDVSGDQRSYHQHTMGLVRMSARMIENHWLSDDCSSRLRLHFHSRAEFVGSLLEGIIVVDPEGRITGSNRSALDQLGLSAAALRRQTLASLLGTSVPAVMDHFRSPLSAALQLKLPDGQLLHLSARFNWGSRPVVNAGLSPSQAPAHLVDTAGLVTPDPARPTARDSATPQGQVEALRSEPARPRGGLNDLATGDARVASVIAALQRVRDRNIPTVIVGETGTGKELLARAIHHDSGRRGRPFIAVRCACIPEALMEAELFGCEEAVFTGARRHAAQGLLVQAHGGSLWLDDIDDMPLPLQARLLQVLQERQVKPLGSRHSVPVDLAVIAASRHKLQDLVAQRRFRDDLYHRLNGLNLRLPALRERSDLVALAQRILSVECPDHPPKISASVMALFQRHRWPGNIRQLTNVLRMAALMAADTGVITEAHLADDFMDELGGSPAAPREEPSARATPALQPAHDEAPPDLVEHRSATAPPGPALTMKDAEREAIRRALEAADGNISEASRQLGVCRNTIYRKLIWKGR